MKNEVDDPKTKETKQYHTLNNISKISSYRIDFPYLEHSIGHVPDYDEEQESEIPGSWTQ